MHRKKTTKVYLSSNPINKKKSSNPFASLTYHQLENLASTMLPPPCANLAISSLSNLSLPSNVKHKLLLALILAKTSDREDIVDAIVSDLQKNRRGPVGLYGFFSNENKENLKPSSPNLSEASTLTYYSSEFGGETDEQSASGAFELCQLTPLISDNNLFVERVHGENTKNFTQLLGLGISDTAHAKLEL